MPETKKNAKDYPLILYGLHFEPGVAEYVNPETGEPYRLLVQEECAKRMDPTFARLPVHVEHMGAEDKDMSVLEDIADGYVIESFYNPPDGKHWVKFMVITDAGMEAVAKGWKLSNAWDPVAKTAGGEWHSVQYDFEVVEGVYRHLAIVPNPRYESSIILTCEEFKVYNESKVKELETLKNSKEQKPMSLIAKFFNSTAVDEKETAKILNTMLQIETKKGVKSITVAQLINDAKKNDDDDDMMNKKIKLRNGEETTVGDLVEKYHTTNDAYNGLKTEHAALVNEIGLETKEVDPEHKNDDDDDDTQKNGESDDEYKERMKNKKKNAKKNDDDDDKDKDAKKNDDDKKKNDAKAKNAKHNAILEKVRELKNGGPTIANTANENFQGQAVVVTSEDQLNNGAALFGNCKPSKN